MPTTVQAILKELAGLGSESYRKIMRNHGAREPLFGVKIADLKKIQKRVKKDYQLALDLFDTGNYDAMYLAGLIADDARMTKTDLQRWADGAYCGALGESIVAWVAAESPHGWEIALRWIDSKREGEAAIGWATLGCVVALRDDAQLDLERLEQLLQRVGRTIHDAPNRARYAMNAFVIALGSYVKPLSAAAIAVANKIGAVTVDMGNTACKVPSAAAHIEKVKAKGALGNKRKTVKC